MVLLVSLLVDKLNANQTRDIPVKTVIDGYDPVAEAEAILSEVAVV